MALFFCMKLRISVRNLAFRPLLVVAGLLAIALCLSICITGSYLAGLHESQIASADTLNPPIGSQKALAAGTVSKTVSASSKASGASTQVNEPIETCVPFGSSGDPSPLPLSDNSTGLIQQIDQPLTYQIFGRSADALRNQVKQCAPKDAGQSGASFAAQTNYRLLWRYKYTDTGNMCKVADASVSIHINQVMPLWRPDNAPGGLLNEWNDFMRNLNTHEAGHVTLDLQYAQNLLNDLRNFPSTPCSQLQESVRHLADTDIAELAQANDNYDSTTNHGATQGAILP
jgi:predicted secreted Zn-dependent protease